MKILVILACLLIGSCYSQNHGLEADSITMVEYLTKWYATFDNLLGASAAGLQAAETAMTNLFSDSPEFYFYLLADGVTSIFTTRAAVVTSFVNRRADHGGTILLTSDSVNGYLIDEGITATGRLFIDGKASGTRVQTLDSNDVAFVHVVWNSVRLVKDEGEWVLIELNATTTTIGKSANIA